MKSIPLVLFAVFISFTLSAQLTRLTHPSPTEHGHFGVDLHIFSSTIAVAEPNYTQNISHVGRVHLFTRNASTWDYGTFILSPVEQPFIHFGTAVTFDDRFLVISAPDLQYGSVYIYAGNGISWTLMQELKLPLEHRQNHLAMRFGEQLKLAGDWLAITAPGYSSSDEDVIRTGAVFIFHFDGQAWTFTQKIMPPDMNAPGLFGEDIEMSSDLLSISAPKGDGGDEGSGVVYLYRLQGLTWNPDFTFINPNSRPNELFGQDVALSDDIIVIGVPMHTTDPAEGPKGGVHVFQRIQSEWVRTAFLEPQDGRRNDMFGSTVVVSDGHICVAAPRYDHNGMADVGKVYVFQVKNGFWTETQSYMAPVVDMQPHMQFGAALHLHQNQLVIGSHLMNNTAEDSGIAYETDLEQIVDTDPNPVAATQILLDPNPARDQLYLHFQHELSTPIRLTIYAIDGKPVLAQTINNTFANTCSILISALPEGTYFLQTSDGHQTSIQKWIKV